MRIKCEPPSTSIESQVYIDGGTKALRAYRESPDVVAVQTIVKTSADASRRWRTIDGLRQYQYRMGCTRCGLVRWLPMVDVGTPHCLRGWFGFLLKKGLS